MNVSLHTYTTKLIASALFLLAFVSCSNETPDGPLAGETRLLNITFSTANDHNATEDEGIRTLKLVFVDEQNTIVEIKDFSTDEIEADQAPILQGHITQLEIEASSKAVYAFANIDGNKNISDPALQTGKVLDADIIAQIARYLNISKETPIPMSSYRYSLPEKDGVLEDIVLYRMIAKVEVTITNQTTRDIQINELKLQSFQHRDIYLLPYEGLQAVTPEDNKIPPQFPESSKTGNMYDLPLTSLQILLKPNKSEPAYFYVHETDLGDKPISIYAKIDNKEKTPSEPTQFTFVRRNDFLKIPLFVSDYTLNAKIKEERAPIGGYPYTALESRELTQDLTYKIQYGGKIEMELSLLAHNGTKPAFTINSVTPPEGQHLIEKEIDIDRDNQVLTLYATGATGSTSITLSLTCEENDLTYIINLTRSNN